MGIQSRHLKGGVLLQPASTRSNQVTYLNRPKFTNDGNLGEKAIRKQYDSQKRIEN